MPQNYLFELMQGSPKHRTVIGGSKFDSLKRDFNLDGPGNNTDMTNRSQLRCPLCGTVKVA